jgi:hypothetical protein
MSLIIITSRSLIIFQKVIDCRETCEIVDIFFVNLFSVDIYILWKG